MFFFICKSSGYLKMGMYIIVQCIKCYILSMAQCSRRALPLTTRLHYMSHPSIDSLREVNWNVTHASLLFPDKNCWSMDIHLEACHGQHYSVPRTLYQYAKQITGLFIFTRGSFQDTMPVPSHKSHHFSLINMRYISIFIEIFRHAVGEQHFFFYLHLEWACV